MKIKLINQIPGGNTNLFADINEELSKKNVSSLRCLMAYTSWEGISLIHESLEKINDESKSSLKLIIGLSDSGYELDVVRYFGERLHNSEVLVFNASNPQYIFHPKVYIIESKDECKLYIGSNNLTYGGLFGNSECIVKMSFVKTEHLEFWAGINNLWQTYYNPQKPFGKSNLQKINQELLDRLNDLRQSYQTAVKRERKYGGKEKAALKNLFGSITIPAAPTTVIKSRKNSKKESPLKNSNKRVLLLEVLNETGTGGTQIQIPSEVLENYFKVQPAQIHKTIQISVNGMEFRPAVICKFPNFTYRLNFSELYGVDRPLLLKFDMDQKNKFKVYLLKGRNYHMQIKRCTNQTREGAKKWQIL